MIRVLIALMLGFGIARADDPAVADLEKQIAELKEQLAKLKGSVKKPLTIAEAATWKSIRQAALSNDGRWFAYRIGPMEGETECVLRNLKDGKETRFYAGGSGAMQFSFDSQWFACAVTPVSRGGNPLAAALAKPKVVLIKLGANEKTEFEGMISFQFNGESATHIAFRKSTERPPSPTMPGTTFPSTPPAPPATTSTGSDLLLRELASGNEMLYGNVSEFGFNKAGNWLAMLIDATNQTGNGIHLRDMKSNLVYAIEAGKANYKSLNWHDEKDAFALLKATTNDDYEKKWHIVLGFTDLGPKPVKFEYDPKNDKTFPIGMGISENRNPAWTRDLEALTFGIAEQKKKDGSKEAAPTPNTPEKKDAAQTQPPRDPRRGGGGPNTSAGSAADTSKPDLVIWHWKDERLQPMQQVQANFEKLQTYLSVFRIKEKNFIRLADESCRNVTLPFQGTYAIGMDNKPYQYMTSLNGKQFMDVYVINMVTGQRAKVLEKLTYYFGQSPTGTHFLYYQDGNFYSFDIKAEKSTNLTEKITATKFIDAEDDHNIKDPPVRPLGWSTNGEHVLLSDGWDLWKVNNDGSGGVNLTVNGRMNQLRYTQFIQFHPNREVPGFDFSKTAYTRWRGEWTKNQGIGLIRPDHEGVEVLYTADAALGPLMKARNADVLAFTRGTVKEYPDYYFSDTSLKSIQKITTANAQQKDYLWCSGSRLVDYKGVDGKRLQGALYLPANYEPGKKYPTIVYIYEKLSDNLHNYSMPSNMGFNTAIYTSNGYAVFTPDITYRLNDPGVSAVECILPALDAAIETGIVDPEKIGLQGHSWGGYQTAFLITQTNRFKAAVAGAPLTDLVSMYSSVYWNSGSANQPIFESSQGRFTGGYWEQQDAYIRNSPVFHATKVQTPLVILHNDKDGAVDFTQGIEYYNTLRRLQKPVVMLQYKGENHGLVKPENRKDYSIRMREFFDHYLQGKPAPDWWTDGVPHLKLEEHLKKRKQ